MFLNEDMQYYTMLNEVSRIRTDLKNTVDELVSTKDRVDISLKEYEELKRINKDLMIRLNDAERLLGAIGILADMVQNINPDTVKVYSTDNYNFEFMNRTRRFRIEFDMED